MTTPPRLRITTTEGLLAALPHLLGFTPENSLVVLAAPAPGIALRTIMRYDLPDPPDTYQAAAMAGHLAAILARDHMTAVTLAGYGPGRLVTPVTDAARAACGHAGLDVHEALRIEDGRFWSYLCTDPSCCPAEGVAFDPAAHPAAARAAEVARRVGLAPALASRADLAATIEPVTGPAARAMEAATRRAERTVVRLTARDGAGAVEQAALTAVRHAIGTYRDGGTLRPDARFAWLTVVLSELRIRDDAWARMDPARARDHRRLWTDTLRRARPGYAAAPACLLAFTAWQLGDGALAALALDRALADTPDYSMAALLREAISAGLGPSYAVLPLTPEQVADSYRRNGAADPGPATT